MRINNGFLKISILILIINSIIIFSFVKFDRIVYSIFFYHVAAAWLSYITFTVSLICSIIYIRKKKSILMKYSINSVKIGIFFTILTLISGSLWFNATSGDYNGIFWTWNDPRQLMTLILLISYITLIIFHAQLNENQNQDRLTALLSIILYPTIPLSYFSSIFFNSLHPRINPNPGESGFIYWDFLKIAALLFNLFAITLFYLYILKKMVQLSKKEEELSELIQEEMEDI